MALAHDWTKEGLAQDCIKGAVATSGVFDLDMVMKISVQEQVRMTPQDAKLNSPLSIRRKVKCPLVVAVGSAEPKGWQQMSEDYFNYCKQHGMNAEYLVVPGANHYTMSEHYWTKQPADPGDDQANENINRKIGSKGSKCSSRSNCEARNQADFIG